MMAKGQIVVRNAVSIVPGFLFFIDKQGNVRRIRRGQRGKGTIVVRNAVRREKGFLYFLDKQGNIRRSRMKRR